MDKIIHIPNGTKNLNGFGVDFRNVYDYFVEALDANGNVIATTTINKTTCCCPDGKIRIHFLNYLGEFDAINFLKPEAFHEISFDNFQKELPINFDKQDFGTGKTNIRTNDTFEAKSICYGEDAMEWVKELFDSPLVFLEWKGVQEQTDDFIPIIITSKKIQTLKNQNEFRYIVTIEYTWANEYITIRN